VRPFEAGHGSSTVDSSNGYAKSYEVDGRLGANVVELLARNFPNAVDSILMSRNTGYNSPGKEAAWS